MGVVISHQAHKDALFVDSELEACYPAFAGKTNTIDEFVKYIKDGGWIDHLADSTFFATRKNSNKLRVFAVTFYTTGLLSQLVGGDKKLTRHDSASVRSSSVSTRDSYQAAVENFAEFYVNIEEKTCFKTDEMMAFLVSIVYPFYMISGSRKAERAALNMCEDSDDYTTDGDTSPEGTDINQLQELLLSTAAFFDETDLRRTLTSRDWLSTLCRAVNECSLDVCICRVDTITGLFPPVLVNNVARKRISLLNRSCKSQELDFLQLWSIEYEDALHVELHRSLQAAEPMQLFAGQSFSDRSKTVLEVTHIFDELDNHRFVLGVQMTVPQEGRSKQHLQYLRDTSLLIGHLIKTSSPPTPAENSAAH